MRESVRWGQDSCSERRVKIKIAIVEGDDVTARISSQTHLPEISKTVAKHGLRGVGVRIDLIQTIVRYWPWPVYSLTGHPEAPQQPRVGN